MNDNELALIQSKQIMEEYKNSGCLTFNDFLEKRCVENYQQDFKNAMIKYFKEIDRVDKKYSDKLIEFVKTLPKQEISDKYTWKLSEDEHKHKD